VEGLQAGADDYLVKPFAARELLARVEAHIKLANLRRETVEREERLRSEAELERQKLRASEERLVETSRLYHELQNREAKIRRLVDANIIGIFIWNLDGQIVEANDAFLRMVGYDREDITSCSLRWTDLTPPEWRERNERALSEVTRTGSAHPFEKEYFRKDGSRVPVLLGGALFEESRNEGVAFVVDLTERKRAEAQLTQASEALRESQMELAHANRVATMGQLSASIAHELKQPIAVAIGSAQAAFKWLGKQPPELEEVQQSLSRIVEAGTQATDFIERIRGLFKKGVSQKDPFDINKAILDVVALTCGEMTNNRVSVQTQFADGLPFVKGDRVQLQQVMLNLIINAIEAMTEMSEGSRQLLIGTRKEASDELLVTVQDSGPGLSPGRLDNLFDAFYTTKPDGMGMGLSICRSIVEAHGGRLWASANVPRGAMFQFTVPAHSGITS
jgi:PAS domain S-box-containing protein